MPIKNFLVYTSQKRDFLPGVRYANARFFVDAKQDLPGVIVVGQWQKVIDAYRYAFPEMPLIEVADEAELVNLMLHFGDMEATALPAPEAQETNVSEPSTASQVITIPADWRENLAWPVLRSLASSVSDTPVRNRADAEAAIEGELARRAG